MVRFAAVTTDYGDTGTPRAGARAGASHRRRTQTHRARSARASDRTANRTVVASEMNRRHFLGSLAATVVAGVGAAWFVVDPQPRTFAQTPPSDVPMNGP